TNPLADQPGCRALKLIALEQREVIAWGKDALAALIASGETEQASAAKESASWATHLAVYLAAARGIDGTLAETRAQLPAKRAATPFAPQVMPRRDARFTGLF